MFYSSMIFVTKGKLAPIWLAANWNKKFTKKEISEISVNDSVSWIISPAQPIALRLSGKLLKGVVRLWQRKTGYLHEDCNAALRRIQGSIPRRKQMQKGTMLSQHNSADSELITISESFVQDLFSGILWDDMRGMSVEDIQNFMDEGRSFVVENDLQGAAHDIQLSEDHTGSFDLSRESSSDNTASLLLGDHDDLLEMDNQSEAGYSILMEALQCNDDINHNSSVEKGQNLSVDIDDLTNSHVDRLSDNEELMTDISGEMEVNKENLSLNSISLLEEAKKDISNRSIDPLGLHSLNSSSELNIVDSIFGENLQGNQARDVQVKKRVKRRRKRPRKLVKDDITELANEIIRAQLRDASDIVFKERPLADLRSRAETVFSRKIDYSLILDPILPGYSSELKECYEQCWRGRKKRKYSKADKRGELQPVSLDSIYDLPAGGMSGEENRPIALSSIDVDQDSHAPAYAQSSLSISSENNPLYNDLENSMEDISSLLGPDRSMSSASKKPNRASESFFLSVDNAESIDLEDQTVDMNAGWSTRTQKMVKYLSKKEGTHFVFQDMVKDKNPRMVAGFFYELLVLKTHNLITLSQEGTFGNISFSKGF